MSKIASLGIVMLCLYWGSKLAHGAPTQHNQQLTQSGLLLSKALPGRHRSKRFALDLLPSQEIKQGKSTEPEQLNGVNMAVKVTNKNSQDMWDVSNFLLDDGVRLSILEAIKQNLKLTNPKDIEGIDKSLKASFIKIRDEAVHVDKPQKNMNKNTVLVNVPLTYPPKTKLNVKEDTKNTKAKTRSTKIGTNPKQQVENPPKRE